MTTQTETNTPRKPSHRLYVITGTEDRPVWTPIGAAWPNKDGFGFSIACIAIPTNGRIVMRHIKAREDNEQGRLV